MNTQAAAGRRHGHILLLVAAGGTWHAMVRLAATWSMPPCALHAAAAQGSIVHLAGELPGSRCSCCAAAQHAPLLTQCVGLACDLLCSSLQAVSTVSFMGELAHGVPPLVPGSCHLSPCTSCRPC